jgi:hypothetical protein
MQHPLYGKVVTTAGHLFLDGFVQDERVLLTSAATAHEAIAVRVQLTPTVDYALLQPISTVTCANQYLDLFPIRSLHHVTTSDVGAALQILTADGRPRSVICRGVAARATIDGRPMNGLILTDWRTQPGDSGACLVDTTQQQRAWGLLVGRIDTATFSLSVFAPASQPIFQEAATFIT